MKHLYSPTIEKDSIAENIASFRETVEDEGKSR